MLLIIIFSDFSHATALAEHDSTNLSCMLLYADKNLGPPGNGISTRNFLISSPDLGTPSKFTLE